MMMPMMMPLLFLTSVLGHGFLYFPGAADSSTRGAIRNYNAIDNNIDSLRNPNSGGSLCRGASPGPITAISLSGDKDFTITMAFSVGAQHIGPCSVEILDAKNPSAPGVRIASVNGCATRPIAAFETDSSGPASKQCPGKLPSGLVTDDMCLHQWTFKPTNIDKITCSDCILRWTWDALHLGPANPEKYENCADVTVSKGGSNTAAPPQDPNPVSRTNAPAAPETKEPPKAPAPAPAPPAAPKDTVLPKTTEAAPSTNGVSKCNCSDKDTSGPYFRCTAKKSTDYCVCYPDSFGQTPVLMQCATGTQCVGEAKFIYCL